MTTYPSDLIQGSTKANQIDNRIMDLVDIILDTFATSGLALGTEITAALCSLSGGYFDQVRVAGVDTKNGFLIHNSSNSNQYRIRSDSSLSGYGTGFSLEYTNGAVTPGDLDTDRVYTPIAYITDEDIWHTEIGSLSDAIAAAGSGGSDVTSVSTTKSFLTINPTTGDVGIELNNSGAAVGYVPYSTGDGSGNVEWADVGLPGYAAGSGSLSNQTISSGLTFTLDTECAAADGISISVGGAFDPETAGVYLVTYSIGTSGPSAAAASSAIEIDIRLNGVAVTGCSNSMAMVEDTPSSCTISGLVQVTNPSHNIDARIGQVSGSASGVYFAYSASCIRVA